MSHKVCLNIPRPKKTEYVLSPAVENILKYVVDLNPEDYLVLNLEIVKRSPCNDVQLNKIKNVLVEKVKAVKKENVTGKSSTEHGKGGPGSRLSNQIDLGPVKSSSGKKATSFLPGVPLIYRADLIANSKVVAIDVEKVELAKTHFRAASEVTIVNESGKILLWSVITHPDICKVFTNLTGMTENVISRGLPLELVKQFVSQCFQNKTVVATELITDLESLQLTKETKALNFIDIQDFYRDSANNKISIGFLTEHFFGVNRQEVTGQHSSITDARLTMLLYKRMVRFIEIHPKCSRFSCPISDTERKVKGTKISHGEWEKCSCGFQKKKKQRTHTFDFIGSFGKVHKGLFDDKWDFGGGGGSAPVLTEEDWE